MVIKMAKNKQWKVEVNGECHQVDFAYDNWFGRHKLKVNGKDAELKKSFLGIDQPVMLGEKECRLVMIGSKADIAVDGIYIESKKPYIPLKSMPWWTWIYIVACIAIPIVALGGALPVVLAFSGAIYCTRISISPVIKTPTKILYCTGITVLAWVLFGLLLLVSVWAQYNA